MTETAHVTGACMLRFAYVTITIMREASAKLCLFQQCVSDVTDLAYVTGFCAPRWQRPESKIACVLVKLYHH